MNGTKPIENWPFYVISPWLKLVTWNWVNICPGNGLVPDGTKALPEPMLTIHPSGGIHLRAISQVLMNLFYNMPSEITLLTHWGRVTQICVGKLTIIGSDNGLSPGRRQAIIWTMAGILLIGFGDNTDLLWWNNVNNQFCQLTTRVS